jgi:hypothetical protein
VPDRYGFDQLDTGTRPEVRCNVCRAGGPPWEWPAERREQHHLAHLGMAPEAEAEAAIERVKDELRSTSSRRRDRHVIHPPRRCAYPFCPVVFQPRRTTALYCSTRCRVAAHRETRRGEKKA